VTEVVTENEDAVVEKDVEIVTTKEVVTEKFISVKATITVTLTVGGFLTNMGLTRGLDDIKDLLGQTLFMELLSAHLDPSEYHIFTYMEFIYQTTNRSKLTCLLIMI
jgi:lipoxygenase